MSFDNNDFDLVRYGVLWQKVQDMDKKIDKMEGQVDKLLALANQSKGGFWAGMTIASILGGVIGWVVQHWIK